MNIPFSPPYIDQSIIDEVVDTLESGWITTGPKVMALQKLICEKTDVPQALAVNSATSGLMLTLNWFGIGPGDEVIIPAYTYSATALAVLHLGATPVMIDSGDQFNMDPAKIAEAITPKTKAIIPVDIGGLPCDYQEILQVVNDRSSKDLFTPKNEVQKQLGRMLVLSDSAHSIGAKYKGQSAVKQSDISVFSLHAVKNVTSAEGGLILIDLPEPFDNEEVYNTLRLWSLNGQTKDAFTKSKAGGWKYDIVCAGFKVNMPDVLAAIGLAQLRKYDAHLLQERIRIHRTYYDAFKDWEAAENPIMEDENRVSSCHLYALRIKGISEDQRNEIIKLISEKGVSVNVHFQPLPILSHFKSLGYRISDYPKAYDSYAREISLPIYPQLTDEEVNYITKTVMESYRIVLGK